MTRCAHTAFGTCHPAVAACYLVITLALTMFSMQPVLIGISLLGALCYGACANGIGPTLRGVRWQLPLILLIGLVNPLFSASGSTELLRLGARAVYLESLCYGLAMGALFVASALWFQAGARLLPFDKVMTLLGNAVPVLDLMVSMTMRLIPRFVRQGKLVASVQDVARVPGSSAWAAARSRMRVSTVLMAWGMEDSLETADAMRARGWDARMRRTSYTRYRFSASDGWALATLVVAGAFCAVIAYTATAQFSFYPVLSALVPWWGYVPYAAWMLVPCVLHAREERMFG